MRFFGGDQGKPFIQIKTHLVTKNTLVPVPVRSLLSVPFLII